MNLRAIQHYLGHASLETTMVYLHFTDHGHDSARQIIDTVMEDL